MKSVFESKIGGEWEIQSEQQKRTIFRRSKNKIFTFVQKRYQFFCGTTTTTTVLPTF